MNNLEWLYANEPGALLDAVDCMVRGKACDECEMRPLGVRRGCDFDSCSVEWLLAEHQGWDVVAEPGSGGEPGAAAPGSAEGADGGDTREALVGGGCEMSYKCNGQERCKHLRIGYDVFTAMGDTHVSSAQWYCARRDDERCVPGCKLYEREGGR